MFSRRLQILIDDDRYRRVSDYAREAGISVAAAIRDAIDIAVPLTSRERARAAKRILEAEPMEVGTPEELKADLDEVRSRRH